MYNVKSSDPPRLGLVVNTGTARALMLELRGLV
jgi:hypothetical protein